MYTLPVGCFRLPCANVSFPRRDVVKQVALACLKELAISLTLGITVASFVPSAIGLQHLLIAFLTQTAFSLVLHSLGAYAAQKKFSRFLSFCEWLTGANFAISSGYNTQLLIHETGHALGALAVYKRPFPQIEIYPFIGGHTQFSKRALTVFGKSVGPVAATCIFVASGPALTLLVSSVLFGLGLFIKEKHPKLGKAFIAWGILDFVYHAKYAYSALTANSSDVAHDFVRLGILGLDPVTATIGIIAIPIIITLGAHLCKR